MSYALDLAQLFAKVIKWQKSPLARKEFRTPVLKLDKHIRDDERVTSIHVCFEGIMKILLELSPLYKKSTNLLTSIWLWAQCFINSISCLLLINFVFGIQHVNPYWTCLMQPWPRGYKLFSCSTQMSMKFILFINVKMQTIVGISTFISRIITTCKCFKQENIFIFQ